MHKTAPTTKNYAFQNVNINNEEPEKSHSDLFEATMYMVISKSPTPQKSFVYDETKL